TGLVSAVLPGVATISASSEGKTGTASLTVIQAAVSAIVFFSQRDGNLELYLMAGDGGNVRRLTSDPLNDLDPRWSPDGTRIAFSRGAGGQSSDVFVMDVATGNVTQLTTDPAF